MKRPMRRVNELVEQELDKELLIYDLLNHKAFCLNETSALIWHLCDGNKSLSEISEILTSELDSPVNEELVWLAVDRLSRENLIVNRNELSTQFNGLSRREIVKKVGVSTMIALPIVSSVISPTAVQAQSGSNSTCREDGSLFGCCQGNLDICNPFCELQAMEVAVMCCSETAFAIFGDTEECNSVCQCGIQVDFRR